MAYYANFDLNKLDENELEIHKKKMEKIFLKNAVLPGHKDYQYDKQVDYYTDKYKPEWDDGDDDDDEEEEDEEADINNSYF